MKFKDKGWGQDYIDNQHRAELLFQQLLTNYPQSDKISDAAYQLGDIYESKAFRQYERAAAYFERCFQWNPKTHFDARTAPPVCTNATRANEATPSRSIRRSRRTRPTPSASRKRRSG